MKKQIIEIDSYKCDSNVSKSKKKQVEWAYTIQAGVVAFNKIFQHTQSHMRFKIGNALTYYLMRSKYKKFKENVDTLTASATE